MTLAHGRMLFVALISMVVAGCGGGGGQTTQSLSSRDNSLSAYNNAPIDRNTGPTTRPSYVPQDDKRYFIEFRSRYALTYGHTFVIFGRMDDQGNMISPEVAGLSPSSSSAVPYMAGHAVPVPADTGWTDGDLEDKYMSANWRVALTEAEYRDVVAFIRKKQGSSPLWHAALYNCNAFVGDIARSMGYKTPFHWLRPQQYITRMREMNGGPSAVGETRAIG